MFTERQLVSLAVAPKITSMLSVIGSIYIIVKVLRSSRRRSRSRHRLLVGMSFCDCFYSFAFFLSSWPSPVGTPGVKFAVGNTTTCTIQGFFGNFNIAVALYNTSLAIYYLMIVRYKFNPEQMLKVEWVMHIIPFSYSILFGTAIAVDTSFNSAGQNCMVSQVPFGCKGDECVRGKRAEIYQWVVVLIIAICLFVATFATILLYWTVCQQDKAITATQSNPDLANRTKRKAKLHEVAKQATLYLGAFYTTWLFVIADRLCFLANGSLVFALCFLHVTVHPLQGAINVIVYMRKDFCWIGQTSGQKRRLSSGTL